MTDEIKAMQAFKQMLIHLRAGGLKFDRKGHNGESLDDPPRKMGEDFSIEINGERDYRLTIGQRTEVTHHRSYQWVFAKLEHLGRKRGRCWTLLECMVATDAWRAQADKDVGGYTMKHPFAIYVFSVDHLAISPERFGSMPYKGNSDRLLGSMAKLFESGKL